MLEQTLVQCPYCGETIATEVDDWDCQGYIEDCPVCCRPIEFAVERDGRGDLVRWHARRDDE
ncbi:CPXCG motif-containing cysteine-rich protein [Rhabdochromatium marinum]|uniref:CPXCG motif-containing cysteine-rich protein n=1 Tax=Rhabdochromatium marinum TaxID=48729 RepID=UPI0019074D2A|nr:CPXCG motif-containing cysteine-rich protein [Rhabdochromatium marinum]MBK1650404.1 restriction endonuclease [Rhabdochromatium marinum]